MAAGFGIDIPQADGGTLADPWWTLRAWLNA